MEIGNLKYTSSIAFRLDPNLCQKVEGMSETDLQKLVIEGPPLGTIEGEIAYDAFCAKRLERQKELRNEDLKLKKL